VLEKFKKGVKVHYLPYDNSKRDEILDDSEENKLRMSMAFSNSTHMVDEKDLSFKTLR